jgi:hypothetical protein
VMSADAAVAHRAEIVAAAATAKRVVRNMERPLSAVPVKAGDAGF